MQVNKNRIIIIITVMISTYLNPLFSFQSNLILVLRSVMNNINLILKKVLISTVFFSIKFDPGSTVFDDNINLILKKVLRSAVFFSIKFDPGSTVCDEQYKQSKRFYY
jgi:hypothetical protein